MAAKAGNTDQSSGPIMDRANFDEACVSKPAIDLLYTELIDVVRKSLCRILITRGSSAVTGSGFLFKYVRNGNEEILGLMTNNHVISKDVFDSPNVSCSLKFESLKLNFELKFKDCKDFVTSLRTEMDATYFRLPEEIIKRLKDVGAVWLDVVVDVNVGDQIFIVQHPVGGGKYTGAAALAYGLVDEKSGYNIYHKVDTETGSSGSPVVRFDGSLVGLHRASHDSHRNRATNLKNIVEKLLGGTVCSGSSTRRSGGPSLLSTVTNYLSPNRETEPINDDIEGTPVDDIKPVGSTDAKEIPRDMDVSEGGLANGSAAKRRREDLKNDEIKRRVRSNFSKIVLMIDPQGYIFNSLLEKGILTGAQYKELNEKLSDRERSSELLYMLHRGEHPTAYRDLLQLMEEHEDYTRIADIIYGNERTTDTDIKEKIYKNYAALAAQIESNDQVLSELFGANIFTDAECDAVKEASVEYRGREFLQRLLRKPNSEACEAFLDLLMKQQPLKWLADLININNRDEVDQKEYPGLTNDILKQRVVENYSPIVTDFNPTGFVLDWLFQEKVLTAEMYEKLYKNTPPGDRGRVLIVHLRQGWHPTSFLSLLSGLKREGHWEHIIDRLMKDHNNSNEKQNLMKEKPGFSNGDIKTRVRKNFTKFVAGFDPKSLVLDGLLTANVITPKEWEEFYIHSAKNKDRDRGSKLISYLLNRQHPTAFVVLLNVMEKEDGFEHKVKLITDDS